MTGSKWLCHWTAFRETHETIHGLCQELKETDLEAPLRSPGRVSNRLHAVLSWEMTGGKTKRALTLALPGFVGVDACSVYHGGPSVWAKDLVVVDCDLARICLWPKLIGDIRNPEATKCST